MRQVTRSYSLIGAVGRVFALAFLLAAGAAVLLVVVQNRATVADIENQALEAQADVLADYLRRTAEGDIQFDLPPSIAAIYSPLYGRYAYSVIDAGQRQLLFTNLPTTRWLIRVPQGETRTLVPFEGFEQGRRLFSGISKRITVDDTDFLIQVGQDLRHPDVVTDDILGRFTYRVAWVVLPVFLILGFAVMATLRLQLRPINELSAHAGRVDAGRPGERLPEAGMPSEILPLVHAANEALARLEAASALQRDFIANAAHELRTPLAVLQAHADLLEDRRVAGAMTADIQVLERLVTQLLSIAQIDALSGPPPRQADLVDLVEETVRYLTPLARRRDVKLAFEAPDTPVMIMTWDEVLTQAFVNLVENAIGHAPSGTTVTVAVERPATVTVSDQGPGVPAHERDVIFHRFWRKSRGEGYKKRGAGLGLAIVRRAAELHGARVSVDEAPAGGALFRFQLRPLSSQPEPASATTPAASAAA